MKSMRLSEVNKYVGERCMMREMNEHKEGYVHNTGIKTKAILQEMGHEMKVNPPKILAKTRKKHGKARAEKQRKAILLSKAREAGAHIKKGR